MRILTCTLIGAVAGWLIGWPPILAAQLWLGLPTEAAAGLAVIVCMATGCASTLFVLYRWGDL